MLGYTPYPGTESTHMSHGDLMSIGQLAGAAGVGVETIRFYQRTGLLAQPARSRGQIRRYHPSDASRVRFVKSAQGLGFSLVEVADLLRLVDGTRCDDAKRIADARLRVVQAKLRELRRIEKALRSTIAACSHSKDRSRCPLIVSLKAGTSTLENRSVRRGSPRSRPDV